LLLPWRVLTDDIGGHSQQRLRRAWATCIPLVMF
jgi:hypothetical protein